MNPLKRSNLHLAILILSLFVLHHTVYGQSEDDFSWGLVEFSAGLNGAGPNKKMIDHLIVNNYNTVDTVGVSCGDFWSGLGATECYEHNEYPIEERQSFQLRLTLLKRISYRSLLGGNGSYDSFKEITGLSDSGARIKLNSKAFSFAAVYRFEFGEIYRPGRWMRGLLTFYGQSSLGGSLMRTTTIGEQSTRIMPHLSGDLGLAYGGDKAFLSLSVGGTVMPNSKVDAFNENRPNYLPSTKVNFSHFDFSMGLGIFIN